MHAYIIDGIRTPIGSFGGSLSQIRADDMAALVIKNLVDRNPSVPQKNINDVVMGCVNQAGEDNRNVARMALLLAGLPYTVPGETVNRLCASGLSAVMNAAKSIQCGDGEIYVAGGVENMTRSPYVISKPGKAFGTDAQMVDSSFGWRFINPRMQEMYGTEAMGSTAENLAEMYGITREEQDLFAVSSQQKATKASTNGRLAEEIIAVELQSKKGEITRFEKDEFIKPGTSMEALAKLKTAFKKEGGSITAGNSSGLNDGAAALLLASSPAIEKYHLTPLAKIISSAVVGVEPRIMGIGAATAAKKVLAKTGLSVNNMDVIELNEAFAAQSIACFRELGLHETDDRINPNGGAIALGHPLGMSGARIIYSAALELRHQQKRYALVTMCVGVGQGYAVVIERTN